MADCFSTLNICIGSLVGAIAALAWCLKFEVQKYIRNQIYKSEVDPKVSSRKNNKKNKKKEVLKLTT